MSEVEAAQTTAGEPDRDERLRAAERLRRRTEYQKCYQRGRRVGGSLATVHFVPNQLAHPRLGITASRKVGGAVVRQNLKRRVREIYRRWPPRRSLPAVDLVVHLKPEARAATFCELESELLRLLGRLEEVRGGRRR